MVGYMYNCCIGVAIDWVMFQKLVESILAGCK